MKNKILILTTAVFVVGCLQTREDIEKQNEDRQLKEQVTSIQRSRADTDARYSDLENEIRAVSGRVETVEHNQQVNHQSDTQEIVAIKKAIDAQNEKLKQMEQHTDTLEAKLNSAIQAMASAPQAPAQPVAAPVVEGKKGDSKPFSEGEALFSKREFKKALVKFQNYREKNPKGPKAAEATYKIGLCLNELGLKKEAKEMYQETIESFPGTPSAKKAKFRLTQVK